MFARLLAASLVLAFAFGGVAHAIFALMPAERVNEVPVERLIANVERNAQGLTPAQKARTIGRLHLLAYLRQSDRLMVYRDRPSEVVEGPFGECKVLDEQAVGKGTRTNWPKPKRGEICETRNYHLGPEREAPYVAGKPLRNTHLAAAIAAYEEARRLEPENFRTRLALAFAYDCAGRVDEARGELRFVVRRGLTLVPLTRDPGKPQTEWELHVVLSEAVAHFSLIAESDDDKRMVEELKHRLELAPPMMYITPVFVPLAAKLELTQMMDRTSNVAFDFSGQGKKMQLGWLTDKAAWLVWDPRGRGRIESGFQMFGSVTWISFWDNGYMPLAALDDNGDGKISDGELRGLALWRDANANGVSEPGEVKPLAHYKIVALGFGYERLGDNIWVALNGVTFADGEKRPTYDWLLHEASVKQVAE